MITLQSAAESTPVSLDWVGPVLAFIGVILVALMTKDSVKESDERRIKQEDKRRWDTDLVEAVVQLLVITDDVTSSQEEEDEKIDQIRRGIFPVELNAHKTRIYLLSNETIGDLSQDTVIQYMSYRIAVKNQLKVLSENGEDIDYSDIGEGLTLDCTSGDNYWNVRVKFQEAVHKLVVADEVRNGSMPKLTPWRELSLISQQNGTGGGSYTRTSFKTSPRNKNDEPVSETKEHYTIETSDGK